MSSDVLAEVVRDYLDAGTPIVWVVDPREETIMIHRPSAPPKMLTASDEMDGGIELPGLRISVPNLLDLPAG